MSDPDPIFQELEESARATMAYLNAIPEYANARIAIIGGIALWRLFPKGRPTQVSIEGTALSEEPFPYRFLRTSTS